MHSPGSKRKRWGKALLEYAVQQLKVTKVDVNVDYKQAVGFYEHLGFKVIGRSEVDSSGKPYPILFMELK
ncbi:GNAT family N-acetyltransferase [Pontibacter locisalis]|uniref:GNAT family N-acetyltransferase n=1 Tax=Pontibacter locisalis TaxID=1719035 RepID=A0ABW5IQM6_9BACT